MNPITKAFVSNKFSAAEKSLGFGSDNDTGQTSGFSAKELRKLEEEEAARRAKKQQEHDKRAAEREKKREEIRSKYGLQKGSDEKDKRNRRADESDARRASDENTEDKNCCVM